MNYDRPISADRDPLPYPHSPREARYRGMPVGDFDGYDAPPTPPEPPRKPRRWGRWIVRGLAVFLALLIVSIAYLAITAPLSQSLKPPAPPSITLLSAEGTPIAKSGAVIGDPVDATTLPDHVTGAFLAIEDRRFYGHLGIDPRGILRAFWNNSFTDNSRQGGSTITQQLAKNAFLDSDQTFTRKAREAMIALWLEAWLTKDEILSRYLSAVYFGDNVYGLDAAANHYFSRDPDDLTIGQAAMLAGLVKAPSRLAPTGNLSGARARQELVVAAMAETGVITQAEADDVSPATLRVRARGTRLPTGGYFADWVMPAARDRAGEIATEQTVTTTLETRVQRAAEAAVRRAGLREAQVAIVAMRPDGRVVGMVGGKDYAKSPFNRATQARRQPGSTFKLFVYLAALREGLSPDTMIEDEPVTIGEWSPKNDGNRYRGEITLRQAFAASSNVAAARLTQQVGPAAVIRAARDLGLSTDIPSEASIALGTSSVSLLELTAAYAAIAAREAPVRPRGLDDARKQNWLDRLRDDTSPLSRREVDGMRSLLAAGIERGTGRAAALNVEAFGKTGTTQDYRDALFVGFTEDLVVGVWLGNDDNSPNRGLAGGGVAARIWRDVMTGATSASAPSRPAAVEAEIEEDIGNLSSDILDGILPEDPQALEFESDIGGMGLNLRLDRDGGIQLRGGEPGREEPLPEDADPRMREDEPGAF